jgi:hypothetical protein
MIYNPSGVLNEIAKISLSLNGIGGTHYNAKLSFTEGTGALVEDPITGNMVLGASITKTLYARLSQAKEPLEAASPGVNLARTYMEGALVDPPIYSPALPRKIACELLDGGVWRKGFFYPKEIHPAPLGESSGIAEALGQQISGHFELREGE